MKIKTETKKKTAKKTKRRVLRLRRSRYEQIAVFTGTSAAKVAHNMNVFLENESCLYPHVVPIYSPRPNFFVGQVMYIIERKE